MEGTKVDGKVCDMIVCAELWRLDVLALLDVRNKY